MRLHCPQPDKLPLKCLTLCIGSRISCCASRTFACRVALNDRTHNLVQEQSQVDPTFRSTLSYARISARAVRKALLQEKGYGDHELPSRQTIGSILNRLGYRLKKHKK